MDGVSRWTDCKRKTRDATDHWSRGPLTVCGAEGMWLRPPESMPLPFASFSVEWGSPGRTQVEHAKGRGADLLSRAICRVRNEGELEGAGRDKAIRTRHLLRVCQMITLDVRRPLYDTSGSIPHLLRGRHSLEAVADGMRARTRSCPLASSPAMHVVECRSTLHTSCSVCEAGEACHAGWMDAEYAGRRGQWRRMT